MSTRNNPAMPATVPPAKRLLTLTEAATYLGVSKLTLYDWVSKRQIEYIKIGRLVKFSVMALEKYIDDNTVKVA